VAVPEGKPVWFQAYIEGPSLTLSYSIDGESYTPIGMPFDMTLLADEYAQQMFTGSFVGMFAADLHTKSIWADFDMFSYEDL
jgi:xylan 1,4-beta-xylosidase